jgi:hypothetical protein
LHGPDSWGRPDIKRFGNPNGARALRGKQVGNAEAVEKLKADAAQSAADLQGIIADIRRSGVTSVRRDLSAALEQPDQSEPRQP